MNSMCFVHTVKYSSKIKWNEYWCVLQHNGRILKHYAKQKKLGTKDLTLDNYCLKGLSTINKSIEIEKRVEVAKSGAGEMQSYC